MKNFLLAAAILSLGLGVLYPPFSVGSEPIHGVVSIFPLADLTRQVGKEQVLVKTFLPPGASPHVFEPTPRQMTEIADARLFIKIGAGLEFWADRLWKAGAGKKQVVLDLSEGMPLLYGTHLHIHEGQGKGDAKGMASHESPDPHYWLDPILAKRMVERIAQTLAEVDPANGRRYAQNAERYKQELDRFHEEIVQRVQGFKTREYVSFHPGWRYFSKRYELKVIGVIEEASGREPSPKDIARIVKELKKVRAPVVFAEPQFNPKIAEAIAQESGARVLFLDPIGDPNSPDKNSYLKLMRYNLAQMAKAMK